MHSPVIGRSGQQLLIEGRPLKLWGIRVASANKDSAQTRHLIDQLDEYRAHGVNAVTVFYMGCSGGKHDPFTADGRAIDPGHQQRMEQIIRACAERGMVVITGIFYQHAPIGLADADAVRNAVVTVARSLRPYRNIILNIANEQNSHGWGKSAHIYDFRDPQRIIELCRLVHEIDPDRLVGGGGYKPESNIAIGRSEDMDVLLFDTIGYQDSGELADLYVRAGVTNKPLVNVETFGGCTARVRPAGVFPDEIRREYLAEIDRAAARPHLSLFFHNNPWCQEPPLHYELGGYGTPEDPGIRWYFEHVRETAARSAGGESSVAQPASATASPARAGGAS